MLEQLEFDFKLPEEQTCSLCGKQFPSYEEFCLHIAAEHNDIDERILELVRSSLRTLTL